MSCAFVEIWNGFSRLPSPLVPSRNPRSPTQFSHRSLDSAIRSGRPRALEPVALRTYSVCIPQILSPDLPAPVLRTGRILLPRQPSRPSHFHFTFFKLHIFSSCYNRNHNLCSQCLPDPGAPAMTAADSTLDGGRSFRQKPLPGLWSHPSDPPHMPLFHR